VRFEDAVRDLDGRAPESRPAPSLDRIRAVAELLDHPELTYPTVHVTGTNGKSTTARLISALACQDGLTTGTYTSPHLASVTERLALCGEPISEEDFGEEYGRLLPYLEEVDPLTEVRVTYFETLTALAYLWFADKPVQLGVFEVGLGGSWDATNLIRGEVAVLCPIGLDHMNYLGPTVSSIATEKAGIIKPGSVAVVRRQLPEAMDVIRTRAEEVGASLLLEDDQFALTSRTPAVGGQAIEVRTPHASYDELFLPLFGDGMARNAAASITAFEALLDRPVPPTVARAALAGVTSPGRVEVVQRRPAVILDGAHNPDAAAELVATLPEAFRWDRLHLVLGMFRDKQVEEVARILAPLADRAYATSPVGERAAPAERAAQALTAAGVSDVPAFDSVERAVMAAREAASEGDLILVTGSFYTVAAARPLFVH
jgi:dihydrofolate synthase / folylpolyglutamate synthase